MVKTIEKSLENYIASLPGAMYKYKKHLVLGRNFREDYAIEKTLDYGISMLSAGLSNKFSLEEAESVFIEMAAINDALVQICKNYRKS